MKQIWWKFSQDKKFIWIKKKTCGVVRVAIWKALGLFLVRGWNLLPIFRVTHLKVATNNITLRNMHLWHPKWGNSHTKAHCEHMKYTHVYNNSIKRMPTSQGKENSWSKGVTLDHEHPLSCADMPLCSPRWRKLKNVAI